MQLQLIGGQGLQFTGLDLSQPLQFDQSLLSQLQTAGTSAAVGAATLGGGAAGQVLAAADPNLVQNVQEQVCDACHRAGVCRVHANLAGHADLHVRADVYNHVHVHYIMHIAF